MWKRDDSFRLFLVFLTAAAIIPILAAPQIARVIIPLIVVVLCTSEAWRAMTLWKSGGAVVWAGGDVGVWANADDAVISKQRAESSRQ